jgi:hypothetical protein
VVTFVGVANGHFTEGARETFRSGEEEPPAHFSPPQCLLFLNAASAAEVKVFAWNNILLTSPQAFTKRQNRSNQRNPSRFSGWGILL